MDFASFSDAVEKISALPFIAIVFLMLLAACAIAGACIYIYTSICAAVEAWSEKRVRRVRREAWIEGHTHLRSRPMNPQR